MFLRSSGIRPNLLVTHKMLLYVDHMRYVLSRAIYGPSMKSVWRVIQIFSCMMYIDLNHRDYQI
jgi:hypothetical protein